MRQLHQVLAYQFGKTSTTFELRADPFALGGEYPGRCGFRLQQGFVEIALVEAEIIGRRAEIDRAVEKLVIGAGVIGLRLGDIDGMQGQCLAECLGGDGVGGHEPAVDHVLVAPAQVALFFESDDRDPVFGPKRPVHIGPGHQDVVEQHPEGLDQVRTRHHRQPQHAVGREVIARAEPDPEIRLPELRQRQFGEAQFLRRCQHVVRVAERGGGNARGAEQRIHVCLVLLEQRDQRVQPVDQVPDIAGPGSGFQQHQPDTVRDAAGGLNSCIRLMSWSVKNCRVVAVGIVFETAENPRLGPPACRKLTCILS